MGRSDPTEYYKKQLEIGLQYQDFIYEILNRHGISTVAYGSRLFQQKLGENKAGIEIKFDDRMAETGNLYIEVAEKTKASNLCYVDSGILRNSIEYVIGNYDIVYRFATVILRRIYHNKYKDHVIEIKMGTSKGFLLPITSAEKIATVVYRPNCSSQMKEVIEAKTLNDREEARKLMQALISEMECDPNQLILFGGCDGP